MCGGGIFSRFVSPEERVRMLLPARGLEFISRSPCQDVRDKYVDMIGQQYVPGGQ